MWLKCVLITKNRFIIGIGILRFFREKKNVWHIFLLTLNKWLLLFGAKFQNNKIEANTNHPSKNKKVNKIENVIICIDWADSLNNLSCLTLHYWSSNNTGANEPFCNITVFYIFFTVYNLTLHIVTRVFSL